MSSTQTKSFLRGSRYLFFIMSILALSYCSWVLLDARLYQAYQTRRFQQELKDSQLSHGNREPVHTSPLPPLEEARAARAESVGMSRDGRAPLGRTKISTIGVAAMILEGTDNKTLGRAVGHIPGTPL